MPANRNRRNYIRNKIRRWKTLICNSKWSNIIILVLIVVGFYLVLWRILESRNVNAGTQSKDDSDIKESIKPCFSFCSYASENPPEFNISSNPDQVECLLKAKAVEKLATDEDFIDLLEAPNTENIFGPMKKVKKLYESCINQVNKKRTMQPFWKYIFKELQTLKKDTTHITMLQTFHRITGYLPWFKYSIKSEYYGKTIMLEFNHFYDIQKSSSIFDDIQVIQNHYPHYANYEIIGNFFHKIALLKTSTHGTPGANRFIYDFTTLKKVLPSLLVSEVFHDILKKSNSSAEKFTFTISDPKTLSDLNNLIRETSLPDFLIILLLETFQDLYAKFPILRKELKLEETNETSTQGTISKGRKDCLTTVHLLNEILNWMYIDKSLGEQMKNKVMSIVDYLISAAEYALSEITWLDDLSKKNAFGKLEELKNNFCIAPEHSILKKDRLIEDYENLNFTDDFVSNIFSLNKFHTILLNTRMLNDEKNSVLETNRLPAYNKRIHSIDIPLASLQFPLFANDGYMVRNFGGLGFLIGREIFRDFELSGKNYSKDMWMNEYSYRSYLELKDYISNNFAQDQDESQRTSINGVRTVNDIIADMFGLNVSSEAFLRWKSGNTYIVRNLFAQEWSDLKPFFTVFARIFCSCEDADSKHHLDDSTFSSNTARIHNLLQNSKSFAKAFQCPKGANMNPEPKAEL